MSDILSNTPSPKGLSRMSNNDSKEVKLTSSEVKLTIWVIDDHTRSHQAKIVQNNEDFKKIVRLLNLNEPTNNQELWEIMVIHVDPLLICPHCDEKTNRVEPKFYQIYSNDTGIHFICNNHSGKIDGQILAKIDDKYWYLNGQK